MDVVRNNLFYHDILIMFFGKLLLRLYLLSWYANIADKHFGFEN